MLVFGSLKAQHCGWDSNHFVMLALKTNDSVRIHRIYLLDSVGRLVVNKKYEGEKLVRDTARFWQNPPADKPTYLNGRKNPRFEFAQDYFVLPFHNYIPESLYQVIILYSSGKNVYRKKFPLPSEHIHALCTNNDSLWTGELTPYSLDFR